MSSVPWFLVVFCAVTTQVINSSQTDGEIWGIRSCVIQDELKEDDYGCQFQEIDKEDFNDAKDVSCTPEVHSVRIRDNRRNDDSVTATFIIDTPYCQRNHNRSRGAIVELQLSSDDDVDFKIFSVITKSRLQSKGGVTSYTITLELPNINTFFIVRVYPIQPRKDGKSFRHPMLVGESDMDNMNAVPAKQGIVYICKCGEVTVTNNTITLSLCPSPHLHVISSSVTRKDAAIIRDPTSTSNCEEKYSNLVDGNYTILTYFKCENDENLECKYNVTIWTQTDDVKVIQADDNVDVNRVLMITGISTGCVILCVVLLICGILKRRLHKSLNKQNVRELTLKERNGIMLVYYSVSGPHTIIGEFAETLRKATQVPVHFTDDETSQGQRFTNKFNWLDESIRNSSNFVFIATRDLYELLKKKCNGNVDSTLNPTGNHGEELGDEQAWLARIPGYVLDRMRGLKQSRNFIVSFDDNENGSKIDYAHKLSQLSVFQCKGTKLCYVSQKEPMTITNKFLRELNGNKHPREIKNDDLDTDEQEILLPIEGNVGANVCVV